MTLFWGIWKKLHFESKKLWKNYIWAAKLWFHPSPSSPHSLQTSFNWLCCFRFISAKLGIFKRFTPKVIDLSSQYLTIWDVNFWEFCSKFENNSNNLASKIHNLSKIKKPLQIVQKYIDFFKLSRYLFDF